VTHQIRSELFKLRTARSFVVLTSLGVGCVVLISVVTALTQDYGNLGLGRSGAALDLVNGAGLVLVFTLMLGVLAVTTEWRHGSVAPTLLVEPDRRRLVLAKLVAVSCCGALIALVAAAVCLTVGAAILPSRGYALGLDASITAKLLAGMTLGGLLTAAIGVGIGALVRKQTAAVVGILVYLLLLEPLITGVALKSLNRFSLASAISELTLTADVTGVEDALGQIAGGLVLLSYAVLLVVVGAAFLQTRDVTD
jgi:ABC-2 type transport system permease protein